MIISPQFMCDKNLIFSNPTFSKTTTDVYFNSVGCQIDISQRDSVGFLTDFRVAIHMLKNCECYAFRIMFFTWLNDPKWFICVPIHIVSKQIKEFLRSFNELWKPMKLFSQNVVIMIFTKKKIRSYYQCECVRFPQFFSFVSSLSVNHLNEIY